MHPQVLAFAAIAVPLVLTPGIATTLVLRSSLVAGRTRGFETAGGAAAASACYGVASGLGTSVLLRVWPRAVMALQICGGLYVAWLGARAVFHAFRREYGASAAPVRTGFREGFVANALNPPVALLYFLILPRFVPPGWPVLPGALVLTTVHVTLAFAWHATCAIAAGALSHALATPAARRTIDLVAGIVLVASAVKMLAG
ncbi:MAG: LysE family translocator [Acidobacteria bacterium]|nr:LysE family translocator [Acidobacteriota bacterium]